ncbi:MobA/MobL family protein [Tritonibacter mobilis]|uniref:MobA/MobL family protein n=1 Tax=Tritonibacter mobilis TaxID=379347 RepID=UPI001403C950|nr:MobA/MobL family protein [Tritonibacter mobilis]NHM17220.1 MobA/MobL family protein [Tritonibacter mobilis]NHM21408.1 MobA/MobL family protein [Tritonibacter mobilis]
MALFSFRHTVKTFSEKRTDEARVAELGQTAAHLRYICRPKAARVVIEERLVGGTRRSAATAAEMDAQRRRGRVCERFVIALPVEASDDQREALVRGYADLISHGIAGYVAAIHDQHSNDKNNPHVHFVFFDVQQKGGGRGRPKSTLGFARKHALESAARQWSEYHNDMMRTWGFGAASMITHLSYADRGIDRIPTIHEGAGARATSSSAKKSKLSWKSVDQGHTRAEANAVIQEINILKGKLDERTNRLGTTLGGDAAQFSRSLEKQREFSSRSREAAAGIRPPFQQNRKNGGDSSSAIGNSKSTSRAKREGLDAPTGSQSSAFLASANAVPDRRLWLGGRVRRVFFELKMLRDTLKARLLQKARHETSFSAPRGRQHPLAIQRKENKPRLNEAR